MDVRLNLIDVFRQLDRETRQFWVDLINSYLLNSKYVAVSFLLPTQIVLLMVIMLLLFCLALQSVLTLLVSHFAVAWHIIEKCT